MNEIGTDGRTSKRLLMPVLSIIAALVYSCGSGDTPPAITGPVSPRQGDVVRYLSSAGAQAEWSVDPPETGLIFPDGTFVGYRRGQAAITARTPEGEQTLSISIVPRRPVQGEFVLVGRAEQSQRFTSDLWLAGSFGYTGTWLGGGLIGRLPGDRLLAWDLADPARPVLAAELPVDARTVNSVHIRAESALAAFSHEDSADGLNGVTLLDIADPLRPAVVSRFTLGLETGVHNVWLEGNFLYAAADGEGVGLRIIDIVDPARPRLVAAFAAETGFLHDVLVRDGLAFLSYWDSGLIILDVGRGIAGGSPDRPVEVSRVLTEGGQTHNAWYWPAAGYVFVGEEDFETPGRMHVVDVRDPRSPRKVATFTVAGDTPHDFWLDEDAGVLYAAWYTAGLRAIDVTGELLGELEKQGRELAAVRYGSDAGCLTADGTCAMAPQLHRGLVYVADLNTGLWTFEPRF